MPRGDKSSHTDKQKRQAEHIEDSYKKRGVSSKEAEARAWATVNKETGGGKTRKAGRDARKSLSLMPGKKPRPAKAMPGRVPQPKEAHPERRLRKPARVTRRTNQAVS